MTKHKYSMDISSTNPSDWQLLRYDIPCDHLRSSPGSYDNAHLEFWQRIQELEELNARARKDILTIIEIFKMDEFVKESLLHVIKRLTSNENS